MSAADGMIAARFARTGIRHIPVSEQLLTTYTFPKGVGSAKTINLAPAAQRVAPSGGRDSLRSCPS